MTTPVQWGFNIAIVMAQAVARDTGAALRAIAARPVIKDAADQSHEVTNARRSALLAAADAAEQLADAYADMRWPEPPAIPAGEQRPGPTMVVEGDQRKRGAKG